MNFFRDPIWEGIAAIITIIGAIFAIIVFIFPAFREKLRSWLSNAANYRFLPTIIIGIIVFVVGVAIGFLISPNDNIIEKTTWPLYTRVAEVSWDALEEEEYLLALSLTDACTDNFEAQAVQMQKSLSISSAPSLAIGKVENDDTRSKIFSNGILNEVAACYIIKGDAFESLNCINEAREAYSKVLHFPHARVWDPKQEIFWSPSEIASQKLVELPETSSETTLTTCPVNQQQ